MLTGPPRPRLSPLILGPFACHNGSALSSNWPLLCCSHKGEATWHHFPPPSFTCASHRAFVPWLPSTRGSKTKCCKKIMLWNDVFFNSQEYGARMWKMAVENVPLTSFVFKDGVKCCGQPLTQHGECISTAVRVMDRGASLSIAVACFYLHKTDLQSGSADECGREGNAQAAVEEGLGCGEVCPIAGVIKFVSWTHLVSPGCSSLIHNRC